MKYTVTVWFRYVANGQSEKDFDTYTIIAENPQEAIKLALDHYDRIGLNHFKIEVCKS